MFKHLSQIADISDRPMFGAISLYFDGLIFGMFDNDKLYFKIDEINQPDYESAGMTQFSPAGDGLNLMPYFEVPANVVDDLTLLTEWMNRSFEAAARKKSKKKK